MNENGENIYLDSGCTLDNFIKENAREGSSRWSNPITSGDFHCVAANNKNYPLIPRIASILHWHNDGSSV